MFSSLGPLLAAALLAAAAEELAPDDPSLPRCEHESSSCQYIGRDDNSTSAHYYKVEGHRVRIDSHFLNPYFPILEIHCYGVSVLESAALPRVTRPKSCLMRLTFTGCPLPAASSLMDTLATLNLTFCESKRKIMKLDKMLNIHELPAVPPVAANHFIGLKLVEWLTIEAATRVNSTPGFLEPLQSLRHVKLVNVAVSSGELDVLPQSLEHLELRYAGLKQLNKAIYSAADLRFLMIVTESPLNAVVVPPGVSELHLYSSATTLQLDVAPALKELKLTNWVESQPPVLTSCGELITLHLTAPAMHALPDGWLASCSKLKELVIERARNLTALPRWLYDYSIALQRLALRQGVLESLDVKYHSFCIKTKLLELDGNRLRTLWGADIRASEVNLSSNNLNNGALSNSLREGLTVLDLSHNPNISDFCDADGYSPVRKHTNLSKLHLSGTGVTRICRDWRENMTTLGELELSNTQVTELSYEDLLFNRTVKTDVWLLGAPLAMIHIKRENFTQAKRAPPSFTLMHIDAEFDCDCHMYWVRRVLNPTRNAIPDLRCTGNRTLFSILPEDMVCARQEECKEAALPAACACAVRPDDDPRRDRRLVRVNCTNTSLTNVPRPLALNDSVKRLYELRLANNLIVDLYADDLRDDIKGLDLRNNLLRRVDQEAATNFGSVGGVVRLAGNPLECNCSAAPLVRALRFRASGASDLVQATCLNGSKLDDAPDVDCLQVTTSDKSLAWLTAAVLTLVVAVVVFFASRERRFFVLAVLHRWGCVWRAAEPAEEEGRRYDAFVTFSHKDEAVVRELVARLEPPYRLCVHERDWVPGGYIGEQVTRSVRESRRTLALVSRHYLASSWARAEFREAHAAAMLDARPRLLVVLLQEPHTLRVDAQLRTYLRTNTYLRWGEPWFWDKLKLALPPPRPAPPPSPELPRRLRPPSPMEPAMELLPIVNLPMTSTHDTAS